MIRTIVAVALIVVGLASSVGAEPIAWPSPSGSGPRLGTSALESLRLKPSFDQPRICSSACTFQQSLQIDGEYRHYPSQKTWAVLIVIAVAITAVVALSVYGGS
jgi:hypothetical protein